MEFMRENRRGRGSLRVAYEFDRRESMEALESSVEYGSFMLVGGYRLPDLGREVGWFGRPPKKDPERPKSLSPILLTVLERLWVLTGSCTGV